MNLRTISYQFVGAALGACLSAGCTEEPLPTPAAKPVAPAVSDATPASGAPTTSSSTVRSPSAAPRVARKRTYRPPFPNRTDLFAPATRGRPATRADNQGESVVLKGFANNHDGEKEQKVVLAIDGVMTPLSEGDLRYGVQVISIAPPQVVLQRGRSRWTASLQ